MQTHESVSRDSWLIGGGKMGALIRSMDWSHCPLGPLDSWPQSLRTTVNLCLSSNFPINLIWGPEYTQIINDGYWPLCGDKFLQVMGADFRVSWASAWTVLSDAFERARLGETSYIENQRMFLDRNSYLEETFFTFSLSPIRDESATIVGLFHPCTETTAKMIAERRSKSLKVLTETMINAQTTCDVYRTAESSLQKFDLDFPFAQLYVFDEENERMTRTVHVGFEADDPNFKVSYSLDDASMPWPIAEILENDQRSHFFDLDDWLPHCGPYPEKPRHAVILPFKMVGSEKACGALILGVSSRLPFDSLYRDFCEFVNAAVSTAASNARAFEEEKRKAEDLEALDKAKTTFFSNISHEFRTPLTLMLIPIEELLNKIPGSLDSGILKERLEIIHRNSLRLLKLVNTLLDFSRIEAGRMEAKYQPSDLKKATAQLVSTFQSLADSSGISLLVDLEQAKDLVFADRDMWEKIVLNLVSNALKYTLKGWVKVSLKQDAEKTTLTVEDSGLGIPSEELPKLFERFYRVQGTQGRSFEGSGIGLAMVQELVKLHRGTISVRSTLGEGSCFTVEIPMGRAHLPPDQVSDVLEDHLVAASNSFAKEAETLFRIEDANAPQPQIVQGRRATILLVDDNPDMRTYLKDILSEFYTVISAVDGIDALAKAEAQIPDLILSDIMMPRLDGHGLLRRIRESEKLKTIPCILISARAGEDEKVEGLATGADDYLTKPFSTHELLARIASNLSMAQLRKDANEREIRLRAEIHGAKRSNELKDEFLATVTHEIRTPLNAVLGFVGLLADEAAGDDSLKEYVDAITRNGNQLNRIVCDLVDLSKMSTGKLSLVEEGIDMKSIIASAVEAVSFAARTKNIKIYVTTPSELPLIQGDGGRMQQVVWNLLNNSIRFSAPDGRIDIEVSSTLTDFLIQVKDFGEGIDPDFLPYVFDPLRQEDGSSRRKHGGLGLGLSIVRQIVEAHGGHVMMESPGKDRGATVTVSLPNRTVQKSDETRDKPLRGLRILAIDDEEDARMLLRAILSRAGAEVCMAGSASEGMAFLMEKHPDVLLSDIGMPGENGYEFLRRVRSLPGDSTMRNIPAVAVTAWSRETDRQMAFDSGFHGHLAKPINRKDLIELVSELAKHDNPHMNN